jgi:3-isopropylmalate dehydrogenase
VLCGPAGGRFVYQLRARFDLFCKFTPLRPVVSLAGVGVIRAEASSDVDIVMVRENIGGLYFAEERERHDETGVAAVGHRYEYRRAEVARIVQVAVDLASARRRRLDLVVKPGGIERMSRFWAQVLDDLAGPSDVTTNVVAVDNAAYRLLTEARSLDVVVSPNMIGDVLADVGGLLLGSRGMTFSGNFAATGASVFQTGHGAAYDLEGRDEANPIGQIAATAMMLREAFSLDLAAHAVERAIENTLAQGYRTADIVGPGCTVVSTREMAERIATAIVP